MEVLEPFHEATTMLSSSSYPTLGIVKPLIFQLLNQTLNEKEVDSPKTRDIKNAMAADLKSRYTETNISEMLNIAAFLDPRFKPLKPFLTDAQREETIILHKPNASQSIQ